MADNKTIHVEIINIRGREYKIEILRHWLNNGLCWKVFRRGEFGLWDRIPCFSRAEERAFPKSVALAACNIMNRFQ